MSFLAACFIVIGIVLFLAYLAIQVWAGIKFQKIPFQLRLIGAVCASGAFLFSLVGWWILSSRDARALLLIIPLGIFFGVICSWGLLAVPGNRDRSKLGTKK
jgi:hypothetical protein